MATVFPDIIRTESGLTPFRRLSGEKPARIDLYISLEKSLPVATAKFLWEWLASTQTHQTGPLNQIIDKLDAIKNIDICHDHFRLTNYAYRTAKFYILETYAKMGTAFPVPLFISDGEGGIIIKWVNQRRTIRLSCRAELGQQIYLYYEAGNDFDVKEDITTDRLKRHLEWLNKA